MDTIATLSDIQRALESRDPELPRLIAALAESEHGTPDTPARAGALTLAGFRSELNSYSYRKKLKAEERRQLREQRFTALLAPDAEVPPPERLRLDGVLLALWADGSPYARTVLLDALREVPLRWGPWRAVKRIFKEAEARGDLEVYGVITARLDTAFSVRQRNGEIRHVTLAYLVRRAWRTLRRLGEGLSAAYPDAAVQVLRAYDDSSTWSATWVANHIFCHGVEKGYNRRHFHRSRVASAGFKHRAFPELWRRSPRPLFLLMETARSEQARKFASQLLRSDFRAELREVEPAWVARLISTGSGTAHDFVVWLLTNVPRFEQAAFREMALHEPVLSLLESPSSEACAWAAAYARAHARDLELERLILLAGSDEEPVRNLARDLLSDRDPRKDVGLEAWGRLLAIEHAHELAAAALRKHFGARELTPEWFAERLLSGSRQVFRFAADLLVKLHPPERLGAGFFRDLVDDPRFGRDAAGFAMSWLGRFPVGELGVDFLRRALVMPLISDEVAKLFDQERIKPAELGADYLKALAFEPTWGSSPWVAELRGSGRAWARDLGFNSRLATRVLGWLADVRRFSPDQLGFDWLMDLIQRGQPEHTALAAEYMIKAFLPADFAPKSATPAPAAASARKETIDLGGKSFLFTGKLATMVRDEAERKVTSANGVNAAGVSPKLDYLVIGDDGSPLYGQGRKGSKQVKAEQLVEKGAAIRIISETAFLQMLAGEERTFDADSVQAGCARLWELASAPGDTAMGRFALQYIRRHHLDIGLALTDRPVDPGAEIPADFLTFERVIPLLEDPRPHLRELGLELCRWEFARWQPPIADLVRLCETPHTAVRDFIAQALLADGSSEHRRYRVQPERLTPDEVYRFCESLDPATRALGMQLIDRHPRLAVPEELFRLSESPDRAVRAFVIRSVRHLYRDRAITAGWKPTPPPASALGPGAKAPAPAPVAPTGPPARPQALPGAAPELRAFLRQVLFTIPPARPPRPGEGARLKPLPARRAKLGLIEVMRDLSVEDAGLAAEVAPLLTEFMASRGPSEQAACLVALTRIRTAHPALRPAAQEGKR